MPACIVRQRRAGRRGGDDGDGDGNVSRPLDVVLVDVVAWGCATFPRSTDSGKTKHLLQEAIELDANPSSAEEMAAAHGVNLADAVERKLAECRTRTWGEPDADNVVEHVR
jgi:hypothetical protein